MRGKLLTTLTAAALVGTSFFGVTAAGATSPRVPILQTEGQFDFRITVKTSPRVTYGQKVRYTFKTVKKTSGSCSIYRWESDSAWTHTYIGTAKLVKGSGSGFVTWEWDSYAVEPILNLQVFCKVGSTYGAGYQAVTGYWGHD